eukprot:TCALIF_11942-PA protein Name:"Similar to ACP20 Adult-specific cuticular protein ACP-20 (Tenebrio molitor)" AED:0.21 eAED:0.21 QI:0/0/0/0.66/0/0.33/3/0/219
MEIICFLGLLVAAASAIPAGPSYHQDPYKIPPRPFHYAYGVSDKYSGTNFDKKESQDEQGNVNGEYRVALPDGRTQIVSYHANHHDGFIADVLVASALVATVLADNPRPYEPAPYKPAPYKPAPYKPHAEYKDEAPQPFAYQYGVKDGYTGADFDKKEEQDAYGNLQGEYSVALPDGRTQIVTYTADHVNGYVADVKYVGEASYPEYKPSPKHAPAYHA